MIFFSGFGLKNEVSLFGEILEQYEWKDSSYIVAGFSYGAQKACDYALAANHRINTLIFFSPAFFHDKNEDFIAAQVSAFNKNPRAYMKSFYKNIGIQEKDFMCLPQESELESLLRYRFCANSLAKLRESGVEIDVYIGERDCIINAQKAIDFFKDSCVVHVRRNANHILKECV